MLPNFIYVGDRIEDREQLLADISSCETANFNIIRPRGITVAQDVVIITYRASQDMRCGSGHKTGDVNVTSTWVKQNGEWLLQAHTATPSTVPLDPRLEELMNRRK